MDIKEPKECDIMSKVKISAHEHGLYNIDKINEDTDIVDASLLDEDIDIQNYAEPLDEQESETIRMV